MNRDAVVIFRGPTISAAEVAAVLPRARCLPPAGQGDLHRAVRDGARVVALVDGTFERGPAVWHKEILHALHSGVAVCGAASMGALRGAECARFGMRAVGQIAAWYADGTLTDDDEVAVSHLDAEHDWRCTSEALVNVRATVAAAVAAGVVPASSAGPMIALAKRVFYAERSWPRLLADAAAAGLDASALRDWLPGNRVDLKHRDARKLLQLVAAGNVLAAGNGEGADAAGSRWRPEPSRVWHRAATAMAEGDSAQGLDAIVDTLRLDDAWRELYQAALLRHLAIADARRHGVDPEPAAAVAELRRAYGLDTPERLAAWCAANHLDEAGLRRLATDQARVAWAYRRYGDAARAAVADQLRIRGQYPANSAPPSQEAACPAHEPADDDAAWQWYAQTRDVIARGWPDPRHGPQQRAALATHLGFDSVADFTRAVRRAYLSRCG
jgi:hypothetical protein